MKNLYINGLQIHSNTTDLGFVISQTSEGFEFPDIRLNHYDKPGEHGAIVSNQLYSARTFILQGRVSGATIAQYQLNRRLLQNAVRIVKDSNSAPIPLLLKFQTMDDLQLQANVYIAKLPKFKQKSLNHSEFYLELLAPDPYLYNQSATQQNINIPSGGGATYPVIYPVVYSAKTGGTANITNNGDATGPLTSPFIKNLTTGDIFLVNYTLQTGDVLVVDMANKTMVLNGTTNAMQYFASGNAWINFPPGVNNVTFSSSISANTGTVAISYRDAYVGV
jgi:hypothetical protein